MKGTVMHSAFKPTVANDAPAEPDQPIIRGGRNVIAFFGNRGHWGYYDCNWWETRMVRANEDRYQRQRELRRAA